VRLVADETLERQHGQHDSLFRRAARLRNVQDLADKPVPPLWNGLDERALVVVAQRLAQE